MSQPNTENPFEPTVSDIVAALRYCDESLKAQQGQNPPGRVRFEEGSLEAHNYSEMMKNRAKWFAAFQKATNRLR